nr:hypothetical protein [Tanacetum cinerariifolium]
MDVEIKQDDLNQQLLTSIAPEWLMHTIVWRNRSDLDMMSLDDLYNHLKVYKPEVQKKLDSHNMAFISSSKNSSGNKEDNTASVPTPSTQVSPAGATIDDDDIEEMDIKWNMALLSMRADRFWKKTGKKISIQGTDVAGFDKSKVEEQALKALMEIDGVGWDWSYMENDEENHALVADEEAPTEFALMAKTNTDNEVFDNSLCSKACLSQVEGRLVEFKNQKIKFCEKIKGLEFSVECKTNRIENLTNELDTLKKEKEGFKSATKDLDNLIGSQRSDKIKEGLGYSVVPPPVQVYSPPKKDMSWTGLPEIADDTITDYTRPSPSVESNPNNLQNSSPSAYKKRESTGRILSKPEIKFVKPADSPTGNSQINIDDKGYWDSGCSRHMTGNISYLFDYEPYDGGYVSFGQGGCKITGKGTIKTGKLEFENVYFVKDLKTPRQHNMYSIDLNNVVPHKDLTCLVAKAFADECMLWHRRLGHLNIKTMNRTPRQHNMYSIDLNNVVPHKDLTCLVAKASADECMLWHRRLGHLNIKTMNRLVRHNLVIGLPSKCFENDHTCVACLKGKHHKASCKTKLVNSVTKPLHTLHMDLFGPTSEFHYRDENLKELRLKIIKCDNRGEFRNKEMNDFCSRK